MSTVKAARTIRSVRTSPTRGAFLGVKELVETESQSHAAGEARGAYVARTNKYGCSSATS